MPEKFRREDFALFGGRPLFNEPLHVGRPNIGDREAFLERVGEILDRRWLTNDGPVVQEFESALAAHLGVRHCMAICNGTVALQILLSAAGVRGEIILPSFTFVATAHAVAWQGLSPVFADVCADTHNIDVADIERRITDRTSAILAVHLWGRPAAVEDLQRIARDHELRLFFDAAHAFEASYRGKMIGNFGDAEVFSFHATKFFNTLEGGAIATNDDELAERIRLLRNFGFSDFDRVSALGTNGKMNEVSAAMGMAGLSRLANFVAVNESHRAIYRRALSDISGVRMVEYPKGERSNHQYSVVEIDEVGGVGRDRVQEALWAENVRARRYFSPGCHRMEPYRSNPPPGGWLSSRDGKARQPGSLSPDGRCAARFDGGAGGRACPSDARKQRITRWSKRSVSAGSSSIRVSVIVPAYNHVSYIRAALDGVLTQRTDFPWDVTVLEDFSTDGTREIVEEYRGMYPDRLNAVLAPENGKYMPALTRAINACRGDYISLVEGDDEWTDSQKLQLQVDFLDAHPECALSFHNVEVWLQEEGRSLGSSNPPDQPTFSKLEDLLCQNFIRTCSVMIRRNAVVPLPDWFEGLIAGDVPLFLLAMRYGTAGYIDRVMGRYRVHDGGLWSGLRHAEKLEFIILQYDQLLGRLGEACDERLRRTMVRRSYELAAERDRTPGLLSPARVAEIEERLWESEKEAALRVIQVIPTWRPEHLLGATIDAPRQGGRVDARGVELAGWVLGKESAVEAVELLRDERLIQRTSARLLRPDVASVFSGVPGAENSGYRMFIELSKGEETRLNLVAVLQDGSRVLAAEIHFGPPLR